MRSCVSINQCSPLVSVIIPAFNAESCIAKTLHSILKQTYPCLEVLVVDDGSTDRTAEIIREFMQMDSRIVLLEQGNAGVAAARNLGIDYARGEFIAPIDADDLWASDAIAKLVAHFQSGSPDVGVVYAWAVDIDEQDQLTGDFHAATVSGDVFNTLICHNFLGNASSTLIRKTCLDRIGGYDTQLRMKNAQGCEDWDLYLRLANHYKFSVVPQFLVGYRKAIGSMSGDFSQMARSQRMILQKVKDTVPGIPEFLYRLSFSSFYLYLAYQCHYKGNNRTTLYWLWQAFKADRIATISRPVTLILFFESLINLFSYQWRFFSKKETSLLLKPTKPRNNFLGLSFHDFILSNSAKINSIRIWIKVSIVSIMHQFLLQF
jgi:glycosyltransferase involved in cell wall biosynthesis